MVLDKKIIIFSKAFFMLLLNELEWFDLLCYNQVCFSIIQKKTNSKFLIHSGLINGRRNFLHIPCHSLYISRCLLPLVKLLVTRFKSHMVTSCFLLIAKTIRYLLHTILWYLIVPQYSHRWVWIVFNESNWEFDKFLKNMWS